MGKLSVLHNITGNVRRQNDIFFGWIERGGSYCKSIQLHPSYPSDKAWKGGWYDLGKFLMKEDRELRLECLEAGARVVPLGPQRQDRRTFQTC